MIIRYLITTLITFVLISACSVPPSPVIELDASDTPTEVQPVIEPDAPDTPAEVQTPTEVPDENLPVDETLPTIETVAPNCLGDEISPLGQSIADDYESVSYEQIMAWFCNGAEFEDILVALETEEQTDISADEMLKMLADGFTWEEIWQLAGLMD